MNGLSLISLDSRSPFFQVVHVQLQYQATVNTTVQMSYLALDTCAPVDLATRDLKRTPIIATISTNVPYLENVARNVKISKEDTSAPVTKATN
jgi:hypothetical protein